MVYKSMWLLMDESIQKRDVWANKEMGQTRIGAA